MSTLAMYYSFGGSTRKWVKSLNVDMAEIKEKKKRGLLSAFFRGCPDAMKRKGVEILPIEADINSYDEFILAAPVWAAYPAPAFNEMLKLIPKGKSIKIAMISGSGNSDKSRAETIKIAQDMGLTVKEYLDIKTADIK